MLSVTRNIILSNRKN